MLSNSLRFTNCGRYGKIIFYTLGFQLPVFLVFVPSLSYTARHIFLNTITRSVKSLKGMRNAYKTIVTSPSGAISATASRTIWLLPGHHLRSQVFGRISWVLLFTSVCKCRGRMWRPRHLHALWYCDGHDWYGGQNVYIYLMAIVQWTLFRWNMLILLQHRTTGIENVCLFIHIDSFWNNTLCSLFFCIQSIFWR